MQISVLKGKIHRATVTAAELDYVGSITVDEKLMAGAGILEYEKVQVVNLATGSRIETYAIKGEADSGIICLNGAAAHHFSPGDKVIIMAYALMTPEEYQNHSPQVILVDENNRIERKFDYEIHGPFENMTGRD